MVDVVRKREQGSWDNTTERWRWRAGGVSMSPKQLSSELGVEVPETKQGSRPHWNRYLASVQDAKKEQWKLESPLRLRIESLEQIIRSLTIDGRNTKAFEKEVLRCLSVKDHDIDSCDMPVPHPDVVPLIGKNPDNALEVLTTNSLVAKSSKMIKHLLSKEIENQIARAKKRKGNGWTVTRRRLTVFLESIGDVDVNELKVEHYRKFLETIHSMEWTETTKHGCKKKVDQLLKRIEADYNIILGFIRNPDYRIEIPSGSKTQYTMEQLKVVISESTGIVKMAVMLGLNCGFYWGDIHELNDTHLKDGYVIKNRSKLNHRMTPVVGC